MAMSQQRLKDVNARSNDPIEEAVEVACKDECINDDKCNGSKVEVRVLIACFVCKRKFPSEAMLAKHEKKSRLHRENIARMAMRTVDAKGLGGTQMTRVKEEEIGIDSVEQKPAPILSAGSSLPTEKESLNKLDKEESGQCQSTNLMKKSHNQTSCYTNKKRVVGLPEDRKLMSPLNWLIVSNIQFCLADGAVGIECRHCADDISVNRAVNALCIPSSTKDIGKSSRQIAFHHFPVCPYFPSPERKIIKECFSDTSYESILRNEENLLGLTAFCESVAERCLYLADDPATNQVTPLTSQNTQNPTTFTDRSLSMILSDARKDQQAEPLLGSHQNASSSVEFSLGLEKGKTGSVVLDTDCPDEIACAVSSQKQSQCEKGFPKQVGCDSEFSNKCTSASNEAPLNTNCAAVVSYDAVRNANCRSKEAIADDDFSKSSIADCDSPEETSIDIKDPKAISDDTDCPKESTNEADYSNEAPVAFYSPKKATTDVDIPQRPVLSNELIDFGDCLKEVPDMVDCPGIKADDNDCPKEGAGVSISPEIVEYNTECPKALADIGGCPDVVECDTDCRDDGADVNDCPEAVACDFHCSKEKIEIGSFCSNNAEYDADSQSKAGLLCDPENVLSLHSPSDEENLTPLNSFLRKYCVEAFISDSKSKLPHHLPHLQVAPQVGIRCRFCRDSTKTTAMSVVFPRRTTMTYDACMSILQKHFLQSKCPKIPKAIIDELRAKSADHESFVEAHIPSAADDEIARQIAYEAAKIEKMGVSNGPKGLLRIPVKVQESKSDVIKSRKMGFSGSSMSLMRRPRVKASADQCIIVNGQSMLTLESTCSKNSEFQDEDKSTELSPLVTSNTSSALSCASFRSKRSSLSVQEESRQRGTNSYMIEDGAASFRNKRSSMFAQEVSSQPYTSRSMIEDGDAENCTSYMNLFMSLLEIWCPVGQNDKPMNRLHFRCRNCAASGSSAGIFAVRTKNSMRTMLEDKVIKHLYDCPELSPDIKERLLDLRKSHYREALKLNIELYYDNLWLRLKDTEKNAST